MRPPRQRVHLRAAAAGTVLGATAAATAAVALAGGGAPPPPIGTGVVLVKTSLGYQGAAAAGTGMVLTRSGEVLTNNHVIRGATPIQVVVPRTGRTYAAAPVGYSVARDVAVLRLAKASRLATVATGDSSAVRSGQAVTALGNALGSGRLTPAKGKVTGVGRSITATDDQGVSERLTGLIEIDAPLQPGDSGGPLYADGRVVGMDTAASSSFRFRGGATGDGFAIPIASARALAAQIVAGKASTAVHVGATAFLGIQVSAAASGSPTGGSGVQIVGVVPGGPADQAGLVPGDELTAFDGHAVTAPLQITALVLALKPGASVGVSYVDQTGTAQTGTVTVGSGPPQ